MTSLVNTKIKLCAYLGLIASNFSFGANAQEPFATAPGLVSFFEAVQRNHPFLRAEALTPQIQQKIYESTRGNEGWVLESSPSYLYQEPVSSSAFSPKDVERVQADLRLARPVWRTGGAFSLGAEYDYTDQSTPFIPAENGEPVPTGLPRFHQHGVFASYIHPLMKNRGGELSRMDADVQALFVEIQSLDSIENQEGFLLNLGRAYLEWAFRKAQVTIVLGREILAQEQVARTREQRAANLVDRVDLLRAEDGLRLARQRTVQLQSAVKSAQARIEAESGFALPQDPQIDFSSPLDISFSEEVLGGNRTLAAISLDQKRLLREAKGLASSLDPELNLELSGGLRSGDSSYADSTGFDRPEIRVGIMYRYPLGNVSSRAERERNNLLLEQSKARFDSAERSLKAQSDALRVQMEELRHIIQLNVEQIASAEERTKAESERYDQGRSPLTFVIESRDNEAEAHNRYLENAYSFRRFQLELMALQDRLLPSTQSQ